jgi:hypothetical protein
LATGRKTFPPARCRDYPGKSPAVSAGAGHCGRRGSPDHASVNVGFIPARDAEAWPASVEELDRQGQFTFSLTFFEAFGRKPA